jgi:carbon-monoxide dehydrogenase large subunit
LRDNPFGFGAHVAVVEVDRDTGALNVLRYVAVHDCGRVINPKLLEGQVYGAIAQGLGQALGEGMRYSPEGQPLTGTLLDYPLPHAKDMLERCTYCHPGDPIANQSAALEGHWRTADCGLCRGHS